MTETSTKDKILDAAEHLFAHNGYHNTSLREITKTAGANLAAVNYHFGSKEKLLRSILEKRLIPLNEIRIEKLDAVMKRAEQENRPPGVEETLRAFIEPTLGLLSGGPNARSFSIIINRGLSEPDGILKSHFLKLIMPVFMKLYHGLRAALPHLPEDIVYTRLMLTVGATSHTLRIFHEIRDPGQGPGGLSPGLSIEAVTEELMGFVTRGMEGS